MSTPLAGRRVLLVDDNPANRALLAAQLAALGVQASEAADAEAALCAWREQPFEVLITDCQMPGMDGYALSRAIRRLEREAGGRPALVLGWTANDSGEERARRIGAGMDGLLPKPAGLEELREILERLLAGERPAPAAPRRALAVLDGDRLAQVCGGDRELRRRLLESFAASAAADMAALAAPVREERWEEIAALAHRLKGAARTAGAMALAAACEALEQAVRERTGRPLAAAWGDACAAWEALRRRLPPVSGTM